MHANKRTNSIIYNNKLISSDLNSTVCKSLFLLWLPDIWKLEAIANMDSTLQIFVQAANAV